MTTNTDAVLVPCPSCGAKNRVPRGRLNDRPVCGRCKTPLQAGAGPTHPIDITDQTFGSEVLNHPGPVLMDCWAPWCGPCRMVAPVLEEMARDYAGRLKIAKLNVDENPATAARFGIQSIPTLIVFKAGQPVHRVQGALPRRELENQIQRFL